MLENLVQSSGFQTRLARYERPRQLSDAPWFTTRIGDLQRVGPPRHAPEALDRLLEEATGIRSPLELTGTSLALFLRHGADQGLKPLGRVLPTTPLIALYRAIKKGSSQAEHCEIAERLSEAPDRLIDAVVESVRRFDAYPQSAALEAVRGKALDHAPFHPRSRGRVVAQQLSMVEADIIVADAEELSFRYVAREVLPARATGGAWFDDVSASRASSAVSTDLLLAGSDQPSRPIFAELKVADKTGYDANPFYALMQTLAVATQAATDEQRARFAKLYPEHFLAGANCDHGVDAYVLLNGAPSKAHTLWHELDQRAAEIAAALMAAAEFRRHVRRLASLDLEIIGRSVPRASLRWPLSSK